MTLAGVWRRDQAEWWNEGAFLYVGRMDPNKGVPEILTAWLSLASRHGAACPDLWLAGGDPDEIAAIRARVGCPARLEPHERAGRLRWWGYLDEPGISALLLKSRVLLMHSIYEPGGRVVLEAMAEGVPVIATANGFARDLVRDWVSGFIVPHGDLRLLRERMALFARQPLLGPSLGHAARATALAALNDWDFYRTHGEEYCRAPFGAQPGPAEAAQAAAEIVTDPLPRGLVGRYPFAAVAPGIDEALAAAAECLGLRRGRGRIRALATARQSLRWDVRAARRRWLISHLYSIYAERPLWDRGCPGPFLEAGSDRRGRAERAARLPGFLELRTDLTGEFHLTEALPAAAQGAPAAERREAALGPLRALWSAGIDEEPARDLRQRARTWWSRRSERPWRDDPLTAAALRRASLRIAWAELADKVYRGDVVAGGQFAAMVAAIAPAAAAIAGREEGSLPLCFQHGDLEPAVVRGAGTQVRLTGGEAIDLGWWGRDAAQLVLRWHDEAEAPDAWARAVEQVCPSPERRAHVLLWAAVETIEDLARSLVLGDRAARGGRRLEPFMAEVTRSLSRLS